MARSGKSQLGGSWIVDNHSDDGDISWRDGTSAPDSDSDSNSDSAPPPQRIPSSRSAAGRNGSPRPDANPGLIFPTLQDPRQSSPKSDRQASQPRLRKAQPTPSKKIQRPTDSTAVLPHRPRTSAAQTVAELLHSILHYLWSILATAMIFLKQPIAILLGLYILLGILTLSYNLFTSSLSTALSPICRIPFANNLIPLCTYASSADPNQKTISAAGSHDPEFDALMSTQSHFSDILDSTSSAISLPLDMKHSETSIRDLRQIVRFSTLPTRNELVLEFDHFLTTARSASYDLQKFNSHVGRTIDVVLSTARWTQRVLDDMAFQATQTGIIPSFLSNVLAPFQPVPFTEARLLDTYITHTRVISDEIATLISEAQALLLILQNLEDRLDVIHAISLSTQQSAQISKDEVLGHLWTLLGGNRSQLTKYDKQLRLLRHVGEYRRIAWAHVSATLIKLQGMQTELEELRERVGSAEAEASVRKPKERTPLSVHLEAIRLGVERLEGERERGRELERGHVRRVIGDSGDRTEGKALGVEA